MTQPKTPAPPPCVPVYDTYELCPKPGPATGLGDPISGVQCNLQGCAYQADLRSPADCYHSEAYLVGWLVKLYGWRVLEPGTLRRGWNPRDAAAAAAPAADAAAPQALEVA